MIDHAYWPLIESRLKDPCLGCGNGRGYLAKCREGATHAGAAFCTKCQRFQKWVKREVVEKLTANHPGTTLFEAGAEQEPGLSDAFGAYHERAAIREFDGGESREKAERAALEEVFLPPP